MPRMLDLPRIRRIRLRARPRFQRVVGHLLLTPNYRLPPRVRISLEGVDNLPDEPVIFAMNHTDRYNYWPFQYQIWQQLDRYTATWVKGKYYENRWIGLFMEMTNNIPTVSRGYLITKDFLSTLERRPSDEEYRALRAWVNAVAAGESPEPPAEAPEVLLKRRRDILGRRYDPGGETYAEAICALFREMMSEFVKLNDKAFDLGLDMLVFPQGTRSKRLSKGHIGLAQIALHYRKTIVPVGCNGSDKAYPGGSPLAKRANIVYRIGQPIPYAEMADWHIGEPYEPFTFEAEAKHREKFQGLTDMIMDRINPLLDPEYQFAEDLESTGVAGSNRFV